MFLGLQLMIKELQTSDLELNILPAANTPCLKKKKRKKLNIKKAFLKSCNLFVFLSCQCHSKTL